MARNNDTTNLAEMLEMFSGEENPLLGMLEWMCR